MSAPDQLLQAFAQWRHWTETEATALSQLRWTVVEECHKAKRALQPLISDLTQQVQRASNSAGRFAPALAAQIGPIVQELIRLETANQASLAERLESCRSSKAGLNVAKRNLSRVHRSYASTRSVAWQSYS